jgi:EpsI family protein
MTRRLLVVALVLAGGALVANAGQTLDRVPLRAPLAAFPESLGPWTAAQSQPFDAPVLAVLKVDDYINRVYTGPSMPPVGAYVGYYATQQSGATFHSPLNCLPGSGWDTIATTSIAVPIDHAASLSVSRMAVGKGLDRLLILYWYQSHGRTTPSEYGAKFLTVAHALSRRQTDAAFVRVLTPYDDRPGSVERAEQAAVGFVQKMFPLLDGYLPS